MIQIKASLEFQALTTFSDHFNEHIVLHNEENKDGEVLIQTDLVLGGLFYSVDGKRFMNVRPALNGCICIALNNHQEVWVQTLNLAEFAASDTLVNYLVDFMATGVIPPYKGVTA